MRAKILDRGLIWQLILVVSRSSSVQGVCVQPDIVHIVVGHQIVAESVALLASELQGNLIVLHLSEHLRIGRISRVLIVPVVSV